MLANAAAATTPSDLDSRIRRAGQIAAIEKATRALRERGEDDCPCCKRPLPDFDNDPQCHEKLELQLQMFDKGATLSKCKCGMVHVRDGDVLMTQELPDAPNGQQDVATSLGEL